MPDRPPVTTEIRPLPPRDRAAHKGTSGRVAIVAGSRAMSGAAALAARGALRGGAGLVRVLTPQSVQPIVAGHEACAMVTPLREAEDGSLAAEAPEAWRDLLAGQDVVVVGPGLGRTPSIAENLAAILATVDVPIVIDADGLNVLAAAGSKAAFAPDRHVLTPHPGEASRLLSALGQPAEVGADDDRRQAAGQALADGWNATVVLKGAGTLVCAAGRVYRNATGNPGMATGGTGDVLAGLIAALLGQGLGTFDAARLAAHVHGAAGDLAAGEIGPVGYTAGDLAERIPRALADACGWTR